MITFEGIKENLNFIVIETGKQLDATLEFLHAPERYDYTGILNRDDYIDNLKNIIETQCYLKINGAKGAARHEMNEARAIQTIGVNLERMADYCINVLQQTEHLKDPAFIGRFDYEDILIELLWGLGEVTATLRTKDLSMALEICKAEDDIDRMYKGNFDKIMAMLKTGRDTEDLITTLFIFRYLERMGDALLNVGEALIFAIIGEKIKIQQFLSLRDNLARTGYGGTLDRIDLAGIWGTRSGCRISKVQTTEAQIGTSPTGIIFKEGALDKIRREIESLAEWDRLYPGLVPKVISHQEGQETGSMLVEFLPGKTLDEIFLNSFEATSDEALRTVMRTLSRIWSGTRRADEPVPLDYMRQLRARIDGVLEVHPGFRKYEQRMGSAEIRSSESLIEECERIEAGLRAPFSVRIHGDCNVSNMLYDFQSASVRFIDVYRSRQADYVQDVSVFLISNFRIPVFRSGLRDNLNRVITEFHAFGRGFAGAEGDALFEARLALALARSFYTSTRFEFNQKFAKEMFLRAHYLMEKLIKHERTDRPWEEFLLPEQVLHY